MSSVPAARIDGLARRGRAPLRVVERDAPELYPSLFRAVGDAWQRANSLVPPGRSETELGRETGARV